MRRFVLPSIVLLFALGGLGAAYSGGPDVGSPGDAGDFVGVRAAGSTTTTTAVPVTTTSSSSTSTTSTTSSTTVPTPTPTTTQSPATTVPPAPSTSTTTTAPPQPSTTTTTVGAHADHGAAAYHVTLVNDARAEAGLPAVSSSPTLAAAALDWAKELASRGELVHSDLGRIGGFTWKAENLGVGPSAGVVHSVWMGSDAHRGNILSAKATAAGAGVWIDSSGTGWHVLVLGG